MPAMVLVCDVCRSWQPHHFYCEVIGTQDEVTGEIVPEPDGLVVEKLWECQRCGELRRWGLEKRYGKGEETTTAGEGHSRG